MRIAEQRGAAVLLLTLCACLGADRAGAQEISDATVGARVRIETHATTLVTGTVVGVSPDSVTLQRGATVTSLARSSIRSYDISTGADRATGAKRGATVGAVLGVALIAWAVKDTTRGSGAIRSVRFTVPAGLALAAIGGLLGAGLAPEQWMTAGRRRQPSRMRVFAR